jgi:HSP20 family protein
MVRDDRDYWRRRRWSIWDVFDEMFKEMEEEIDRLMREFTTLPPSIFEKGGKIEGPYVYGVRITIGPDGRPIIERFGNVKTIRGKPMISEEREPLVDVFEDKDEITVIAEIPGVEKDKIKIRISDDRRKLIIRASNEHRKYYKEVELPAEVDPQSAKASYRNGVLEVKLKKIGRKEEKGYEVKVE